MKRHIRALLLSMAMIATPAHSTVTSSVNKVIIGGNGSQTSFGFGFVSVAASDIQVIFTNSSGVSTTLTQGPGSTQYQITLNTAAPGQLWGVGGTVTYNPGGTPIPSSSTLTIVRTLPFTQGTSLQNQASFGQYAQSTEQALDQVDMQVQQIAEAQNRVVSAPVVDSSSINLVLPPAAQRANQALIFDGSGNVIAGAIPGTGTISSAMQPVVNAATLAAARTALGLGTMAQENINGGTCGGATIQDDGAGNARVVFATAPDATNQIVTCAFHGTERIATGALVYTLPQANTLFNGFGFWLYPQTQSVTLTPNAADNFVVAGLALSSGTSTTIPAGTRVYMATNAAASSGAWYIAVNDPLSLRQAPGLNAPINLQINASVAANALTIAVKSQGGNDPSPAAPVVAAFRDPTATAGDPVIRQITAALSITVPSGAAVGTASGQASRLWVGWGDNAGVPVLCVYNSLNVSGPSIVPWDETSPITAAAISSGSSSAQTWYCSGSVTAKSIRILSYVESTQATAGAWATSPSKVQLFGPGVKRPGETFPEIAISNSTLDSTTSTTFVVFTHSEVSITPTSAANLIRIEAVGTFDSSGPTNIVTLQLSRGTAAATNMIGSIAANALTGGTALTAPAMLLAYDTPNTTSSQTYAVQGKTSSASTTAQFPAINGSAGTAVLVAKEIQI